MFSVPHLILIFVVALVIFGPDKLPELARNLGKIMGEFKRATGELRYSFEDHLREIEREADLRRIGASAAVAPKVVENTIAKSPPPLSAVAAPSGAENEASAAQGVEDLHGRTAVPVTADPAGVAPARSPGGRDPHEPANLSSGENHSEEQPENNENLEDGGSRSA